MHHRVLIDIQGEHIQGFKSYATEISEHVLDIVSPAEQCELSILLVDDCAIREMNLAHRSIDASTDVLAFSLREGETLTNPPARSAYTILGDVVVSIETARRQAEEHNEPLKKEIALLITHGILHLFGYDDGAPGDYEKMMIKSHEILEALKPLWDHSESPRKRR